MERRVELDPFEEAVAFAIREAARLRRERRAKIAPVQKPGGKAA